MGEDGFKTKITGYVLIALFGMLILTAVLIVGSNYDMDTSTIAGGSLSIDKFNKSISSIEGDAKAFQGRINQGSIWSVIAGVVVEGIFGIAIDMLKMLLVPFDIIIDIGSDVLGAPAFVTSAVMGLIIISALFSIWRLIRIGD